MKAGKKIMKQTNSRKQVNSCATIKKQVNKWFMSMKSNRNYKDVALEIGLPIDGSIL